MRGRGHMLVCVCLRGTLGPRDKALSFPVAFSCCCLSSEPFLVFNDVLLADVSRRAQISSSPAESGRSLTHGSKSAVFTDRVFLVKEVC